MNCNYQTLFSGKNGYVAACKECNTYEIAFLSSLLNLTAKQYRLFREQVQRKSEETDGLVDPNCKGIVLGTSGSRVRMLLTKAELEELNAMLEHADTEERTIALLQMF